MKQSFIIALFLLPVILFSQNNVSQQFSSPPQLPDTISLFGERVPLEIQDVKERLDREMLVNKYRHGGNLYLLKLTTRWLPLIEEKLKEANIPTDFKYLCMAESDLMNGVSTAGATGFWQFMRGTAPGYGLEVNSYVDERYHPVKSTEAAIKYLKSAYQKFGNWTATAASYNCGMGGYSRQATLQGTNNYYDLHLPGETMRYIFRIMTLKYLVENPEKMGFNISAEQQYQPYDVKELIVDYPIASLVKFAKDNGTDYKTLRLLNPWLRSTYLPNKSKKKYIILLPS